MQDGRAPRIRNRAPAAIHAQERQESTFCAPKQHIEDFEKLHKYHGRKQKEFEEQIRRTRGSIQNEFDQARSIFEHALDVDPQSIQLWLMDLLWYKYVYLEELLQNVPGARQVYKWWMQWEPDNQAWEAYIKMAERYDKSDRATVRPDPRVWVKWAKFEEEQWKLDKAREVFQTTLQAGNALAKMETQLEEYEHARVIYKFAQSCLPQSKSVNLYAAYTKFEKQHGTQCSVESAVLQDRRNYDVWFDYVQLKEDVYKHAIAHVPPGQEKCHWRWYIFLWLEYALFEEI
ncbi:hypothetical protein BDR06DRAFT_1039780 [Suillus hirtellus]|nr:hypothetical protein BDR06DRAFT_1039780 [Suillus hirtellus]